MSLQVNKYDVFPSNNKVPDINEYNTLSSIILKNIK